MYRPVYPMPPGYTINPTYYRTPTPGVAYPPASGWHGIHSPGYYAPSQAAGHAHAHTEAQAHSINPAMPPGNEIAKQPFFNITHPGFIKGAVAGAAVAWLLSNENIQHAAIKASVKTWMMLQGGVEEFKERFKDAEAEIMADESEAS